MVLLRANGWPPISILPGISRRRIAGAGRPSVSRRVGPGLPSSPLVGCVDVGTGPNIRMITQEDGPLLSILDILLAHVNICCDGIHRWIVAIGSVPFGLS